MGERILPVKHRRSFPVDLKRQIIEELLSGVSTPAQLTHRYEISSGLLYHWKEQYARGRFNNEPDKPAASPPVSIISKQVSIITGKG